MRVALVHDWLDTWGGGENVLVELGRLYPSADLYTLVDFLAANERARLGARTIRTSAFQRLPAAKRWFRYAAALWPQVVETFDLAEYDVVVSDSHAVVKGVRTHAGQVHICYCHAPARFAWSMEDSYVAEGAGESAWKAALMKRATARFRAWDRAAARGVTAFAANSRHTARGIAQTYGRDATVIYPPVDVERFALARAPCEGHFVTVSRLVRYKRVDLLLEAFRARPDLRLVVVGDGAERTRLAALAPANVQLVGAQDDAGIERYVASARAFVFVANEDFGIAPVEAQAAGVPVIAFRGGGVGESVRDLCDAMPTGVLFDTQDVRAIVAALARFEREGGRIRAEDCRSNARRFAPDRFRREAAAFIDATIAAARAPRAPVLR